MNRAEHLILAEAVQPANGGTPAKMDPNHAAAKAIHTLNEALLILRIDPKEIDDLDIGAACDLLSDVPATIAALYQVNEALQADLRGLRDEGLAMAHEVNEARALRGRLIVLAETMKKITYARVACSSAELKSINDIYAQLAPDFQRPRGTSPQMEIAK
jgi:hypothetical protein